jgi:drug/metabolite transporter (DMT)-like permease
MLAVLLSIAAAACFAFSSLQVDQVSRQVGSLQLVRWQMVLACLMTSVAGFVVGGWQSIDFTMFLWLAYSSVAAVMIGGLTYIICIKALGPRLFALFFTLSSPFALVLAYVFRGEEITLIQGAGVALILSGIVLAILGPGASDGPGTPQKLALGIALGLITALSQALGNLFSRPAMLAGAEPMTAIAVRSGLAALFFLALLAIPRLRPVTPIRMGDLRKVGLSAMTGMFLGMSLLMAALARGDVGIVSTLSSTTPILILPMVWVLHRRMPGPMAWLGACLAVLGTALISLTS